MFVLSDIDNTLLDTLRCAIEHEDLFMSKHGLNIDWFISKENRFLYTNDVITMTQMATNKNYKLTNVINYILNLSKHVTLITSRHEVNKYILKYVFNEFVIDDILVDYSHKDKIDFVTKFKPKYYFEDDPRVFMNINTNHTKLVIHKHFYNQQYINKVRAIEIIP